MNVSQKKQPIIQWNLKTPKTYWNYQTQNIKLKCSAYLKKKMGKWKYKKELRGYQSWQGQKKLSRQFYNTKWISNMKNITKKG